MQDGLTSPRFQAGSMVQQANAADVVGVVTNVRLNPQTGLYFCEVAFGARRISLPEDNLIPFNPEASPWDEVGSGVAAGARAFRTSLTRSRVMRPPSRIAKSFSSARTQFYPHQFKPLLKLLHSPQKRILIGDDVGLGKTIEAGYILTELEAGQRLEHILLVVPARLRGKWQSELDKRFGQRFDLVSRRDVLARLTGGNTSGSFRWITSYEALRSAHEPLRQSPLTLDCVVFDEAHRLRNPGTQQHRMGALLCERSDAVVMLSATPIQTGLEDLYHLARLLLPDEFGDLETFARQMEDNAVLLAALNALRAADVDDDARRQAAEGLRTFLGRPGGRAFATSPFVERVLSALHAGPVDRRQLAEYQSGLGSLSPLSNFFTRTRKAEAIPDTPVRDPQWLSIELQGIEKEIYQVIVEHCRARATAGTSWGVDRSLTMLYRAVASCIPAAMRHYKDAVHASFMPPSFEEPDDEDDDEGPRSSPLTGELAELHTAVRHAVELFDRLGGVDSKFAKLHDELNRLWRSDQEQGRPRRKTLVFSYFRGTVEYLAQQLRDRGVRCKRVHGGVPASERDGIVEAFLSDPNVDVLVTSDVSAEGVDLQRACVLVNYDLPWNPMVVEQRIGRIDRIGQESKVLTIANLVVKDSIEERILKRLFDRVHLFEATIGDMDGILGGPESVEELSLRALRGTLADEELEAHLKRAEEAFRNQQATAKTLDDRARELLAVDQALLDEIRAATGEHQIPADRHLLDFVNTSLHADGAGIVIGDDALKKPVRLDLRPALARRPFVAATGDQDKASQFMRWANQDAVQFTFSREVAYRFPNVELIHPTHPLARWAAEGLSGDQHAFSLALDESKVLPTGRFCFALSFLESPGGQSALRVAGIAADLAGPALVHEPRAIAALVGELLDRGTDAHATWEGRDEDGLRRRVTAARDQLDALVHEQNSREREVHMLREAARVERGLAGFRSAVERSEGLLRRYRAEDAKPFVIQMQEAKVARARERMEAFSRQPATTGWDEPVRHDIAVGLLSVGGA